MTNIGTKIAKGAIWMVLFKLTERSLGLISTLILVRLLIPEDFGLLAMAMSIIAALELLGAFGFDMALIQNQNADDNHYNTAWTFNVIFAVSSAVILVIIAIPAAIFYHEPRLEAVIYFLALGSFFKGFENIGVVAFRKELEFNKEFKFLLGKKLASFATTVPLAFILKSYWALVFGILAGNIFSVMLSYWVHEYRPRLCLIKARELFHFSKWLLFNNILTFLILHSADFIIGRIAGARQLGLYSISFEISNLPTTELIAPINRAVFPGYSRVASDLDALRKNFLNVIALITLFALPAGLGIAVTSEFIVKVALGEKWLDTIPLIQTLAFYGVITALQTNIVYIFLALGKPRIVTALSAMYAIILLPVLIWLCRDYGAIGAAWAYLGVAAAFLPVFFMLTFHRLKINILDFIKTVWRSVFAALSMFLIVKVLLPIMENISILVGDFRILFTDAGLLVAAVSIGVIAYVTLLIMLWLLSSKPEGAEWSVIEKALPRLPRFMRFKFLMPATLNQQEIN